jgi:glycine dehydrogenase subunit 1
MFVPHTNSEREEMLRTIGVERIEDLFSDVPEGYRFPQLDLPAGVTEMEVMAELQELASGNASTRDLVCFLGAGAYNH